MSAFCSMLLFKTSLFSTFWVIFPIWQKQLKIALGQGWKTYIFRFYALCQVEVTAYCIIVVNGSTKKLFSIDCVIVLSSLYRSNFNICVAVANTAFSPLEGPMCPHKKKKNFFCRLQIPTAFSPLGGPLCPHKKKKIFFCHLPTAFSPLGGLSCPHKKKKIFFAAYLHGIFVDGGVLVLSQEKKLLPLGEP